MRRILEFHRFLMALSVRPGIIVATFDHLVPICCTSSMMSWSSASVHSSLLTEGHTWLCHRSLHCLPTLPGSSFAIWDQGRGPCPCTSCSRAWSSSVVHARLTMDCPSPCGGRRRGRGGRRGAVGLVFGVVW